MNAAACLRGLDEAAVARLAEFIALKLRPGDAILLHGDLGLGKTTFARALIRSLLADPDAEVPSPTFGVVQPYETPRMSLAHFDLYRLSGPDELEELGFRDAANDGAVLVEWPERAAAAMPPERLDVTLSPGTTPALRDVTLVATPDWQPRLDRVLALRAFTLASLPSTETLVSVAYLQGDASPRAYARLLTSASRHVLMDAPRMPDGPPILRGLPYSRIAHLAEDVRPFVAIGNALEASGLTTPAIRAADLDAGMVLLEDLGDLTFGRALAAGVPQGTLWSAAVDTLIQLRRTSLPDELPLPDGTTYRLPRFDRAALEIEVSLFLDWYWPEAVGAAADDALRAGFMALWAPVIDGILAEPPGVFLRDFHSPNLFWLPERLPGAKVGVIDFQDALAESWPLDLVSLLQDARIDVSKSIEQGERERYMCEIAGSDRSFDRDRFLATYAAFGAQRNTRLIGLWVRLWRRDGKPGYLHHMARTWNYLERNLEHPALAPLAAWFAAHVPTSARRRTWPT
jgi:tRNA threonylcarbamoyl adenosine modification protein YjeE